MSVILRRGATPGRPRLAVLTPQWGGPSETAWALRQVAGALALSGDVHVLTPQGSARRGADDGVFQVHQLGLRPDRRATVRRDLLLDAVTRAGGTSPDERRSLHDALDRSQEDWAALGELLQAVHPDLVVLADHREVGAARLAERCCPDVPVLAVPLAVRRSVPADPWCAPWFSRAGAAIVFSEAEAALVRAAAPGLPVHHVGLPLAVNPSVQREPLTFVADDPYVLVLSGVPWRAAQWPTGLVALLQASTGGHGLVVSASDRLIRFSKGEEQQNPAVERGSDLLRLLAWARATVILRPGPLFGRRSLDALLHGSPIVVPAGSRAREHAELGGGGLWFEHAGELVWATEGLLAADVHDTVVRQGRRYAEERYSGTQDFVGRVTRAVLPVLADVAGAA